MKVQKLPDDCISNLLEHLKNDRSTLFTCLFVNWFCCNTAVRLLYENPFENLNKRHNYSIISTLINFLNDKEMSYLQRISHKRIINVKYEPLFDYPKYIKVFDKNIRKSVLNWIRYQTINLKNEETIDNIVSVFHHMLLRQCEIKIMKIYSISLIRNIFNNQFIENHISNLSKLDSIEFIFSGGGLNNKLFLNFLQKFSNTCLNLKNLQFKIDKYNSIPPPEDELCSIIKNQRNLKSFKISNDESHMQLSSNSHMINSQNILLDNIFLSLELKKYSLILLDFSNINFMNVSFNSIMKLTNLKYLKFKNCKKILSSHCDRLKISSFKLEELLIQSVRLKPDVKISMIGYLGGSLRRLIVEKPTTRIIETISNYCPNIETLDIRINSRVNLSVFPSFENFKKNLNIKNLNITFSCTDNIDINIFKSLAENLPLNIKVVSILSSHHVNNDELSFKQFLDNVHGYLDTINLQIDVHLETILDYIKRSDNNLKCLGIKTLKEPPWNKEELNLLDKIKDKGVKVVELNSIYKESDYVD